MLRVKLLYAILLGILILFWILYRGALSLQLLLFALALPPLLWLMLLLQRLLIRVQIHRNASEVSKKETFQWILQIHNRALLPVLHAELRLAYCAGLEGQTHCITLSIPLPAMNIQRVMLSFHATVCGTMKLQVLSIKLYDPLHLFSMRIRSHAHNTLVVMPALTALEEDTLPMTEEASLDDAAEYSKTKCGDDPSEVFDVHAYHEGDAISRIHWKLSSKLDELMVKEYSLPIHADTLLLTDARILSDAPNAAARLDAMFSVFYTVADRFRSEARPHSLLWQPSAAAGYVVCPLSEPDDLEQILRQMLLATPHTEELEGAVDTIKQLPTPARIILFTPQLDTHVTTLLPELSERCPLTVFYVLAEDETEMMFESADAYDCIPVRIPHYTHKHAPISLEEGDEVLCADDL